MSFMHRPGQQREAVRIAAVALLAAAAVACGSTPAEAPAAPEEVFAECDPISEQERWGVVIEDPVTEGYVLARTSEHFEWWIADGAGLDELDVAISEAHLTLMEDLLGHDFTETIQFFVYKDTAATISATGMELLIRRDVRQLHLMNSRQLHEVVHLLTYDLAGHRCAPLFEEGLAEAFGNWAWRPGDPAEKLAVKDWTGEHVDVMTAAALERGEVPSLETVLENRAFRSWSSGATTSYVHAASFDLYLIERFGMARFVDVLREVCVEDSTAVIEAKIEKILGRDIGALDEAWRASLPERAADASSMASPQTGP